MENFNPRKKTNMKNTITSLLIVFVAYGSALAGGPWPQLKGNGYFKLSEWWTVFDQHYTDQGLIDPNLTTGIYNTSLYAEYGITNRFTTIVNFPFLSRNYVNNLRSGTTGDIIVAGDAINTIGDIDLGLKLGLTKPGASVPVALTLFLGVPTGTDIAGAEGNLQTGDGEFNQMLQLDAGKGFNLGKTSAYLSAYTAFNHRTKGFSEEFRYGLEFGLGLLSEKLWTTAKLNVVESLKNGDTAENTTNTSIFANNSEFSSIELGLNYYVSSNFGISASVAGAIRGEIIAAAPSYSVGIFYDMK